MARLYGTKDSNIHGDLLINKVAAQNHIEVYYAPPRQLLDALNIEFTGSGKPKAKLLEIDVKTARLTIFPIKRPLSGKRFPEPKYRQIRKITLADGKRVLSSVDMDSALDQPFARSISFGATQPLERDIDDADIASSPDSEEQIKQILEDLPPTFTKDCDYGLGLAQPYRFIVEAVEDTSECTEIVISGNESTRADEETGAFYISHSDYESLRKMLNSTTELGRSAGRTVKETETYNFFADKFGLPKKALKLGRHRTRKLLTQAMHHDDGNLSEGEQDDVINLVTQNMGSISETQPEKLVKLQSDLELVNLDNFIQAFDSRLRSSKGERDWQVFFERNPLILSLVFNLPIIMVQEQAFVGGRKLDGSGDRITDFLVKNTATDNVAIVEIKTPRTRLVGQEFRNAVYTPSLDLMSGIVQVLDQRYQLQQSIFSIKGQSRICDIETYAVECSLIIGSTPESDDKKKSFELFRRNLKDVQIITFDEVREKLRQLKELLAPQNTDDGQEADDGFGLADGAPF